MIEADAGAEYKPPQCFFICGNVYRLGVSRGDRLRNNDSRNTE